MNGIDYFALMRDVTEQYVRELGSPQGDGVSGVPDFRQRERSAPPVSDRCVADSKVSDVANQGKGLQQSIDSLRVGSTGGEVSVPVLSSPLSCGCRNAQVLSAVLCESERPTGNKFAGERVAPSEVLSAAIPSPAIQFDAPSSQERSAGDQTSGVPALEASNGCLPPLLASAISGQARGASIHSGGTIAKLFDAVAVCEERSRR